MSAIEEQVASTKKRNRDEEVYAIQRVTAATGELSVRQSIRVLKYVLERFQELEFHQEKYVYPQDDESKKSASEWTGSNQVPLRVR